MLACNKKSLGYVKQENIHDWGEGWNELIETDLEMSGITELEDKTLKQLL